ncbi:hypothetical protein LCM4573_09685 [Rhizobium sp. LCM 4573]|nr:hypothetical protein LCM4573_09685 [Rhizobium sp. LCM 4573]
MIGLVNLGRPGLAGWTAVLAVALAACRSPEEQRARDLQNDAQGCAAAGFTPGSNAMANCMNTAAAARSADKDRQAAAERQQQARQTADDAAWDRRVQKIRDDTRADADAWSSGTGRYASAPSNDDDDTMPSAAGLDGMECVGTGPDSACNAR